MTARTWNGGEDWPDGHALWWICTKCERAYKSPTTGKPPAHCVCLDQHGITVTTAAPEAARPVRIVQQEWTWTLPLRMQSLLMLAMRGPDGAPKHGPAKALLRELRSVVLTPAFPGKPDAFMGTQRGIADWVTVETFAEDHDAYPHHWLMHFIHAAEVVGQFHPDLDIRAFWWSAYVRMCRAMHMQPEGVHSLEERLGDPGRVTQVTASKATVAHAVCPSCGYTEPLLDACFLPYCPKCSESDRSSVPMRAAK